MTDNVTRGTVFCVPNVVCWSSSCMVLFHRNPLWVSALFYVASSDSLKGAATRHIDHGDEKLRRGVAKRRAIERERLSEFSESDSGSDPPRR